MSNVYLSIKYNSFGFRISYIEIKFLSNNPYLSAWVMKNNYKLIDYKANESGLQTVTFSTG